MTQFQHTLKQLLTGEKTETSRIVKPNEYTWICGERPAPWNTRGAVKLYSQVIAERQTETSISHRIVWERDKEYAIQPARGVHSVGRYRVEAIWRQDVRTLTLGQVEDEGFKKALWGDFWLIWCKMHDKPAYDEICERWDERYHGIKDVTLTGVKNYLLERPAERYQAWRMTIRVLWETVDWDAPAVRALQIEPKTIY